MRLQVDSFRVGPLDNNLYLLRASDSAQAVVVDPSIDSAPARERIRELQTESHFEISAIWNTHGHFDHVYDNAICKREWNVPIWMHAADQFWIERLREQALWLGFPAPETAPPDHAFCDGQHLKIGEVEAQVLSVPGHSPGSVAFWFPSEKLCISGDVIFRGSVGRTDLPGCSHDQLMQSIRRMIQLLPPETQLLPGHGEATTLEHEIRTNPWLQSLAGE